MPLNQLVAYKIIWLEHLTVNQRVLSSSLRGGASYKAFTEIVRAFFCGSHSLTGNDLSKVVTTKVNTSANGSEVDVPFNI